MSREVKVLHVAEGEDGSRLDRWFKRRWPHLSHIQLQKLFRSGQVRVDGSRAKADTRLAAGSQVRVPPLPEATEKREGEKPKLSARDIAYAKSLVLYEDEAVLALNKPAGLAVQGGTKTTKHIDRLLSAWGEGLERPRLVHRLDRDTSGVLLLGKTPAAAAKLSGAFARRRAKKTYWAIVAGVPKPGEGVIELHLVKKGINDREMVMPADPQEFGAEPAETEYVTISRAGHRASWMALRPHTGRTHQLRVHMKAIGHPILGDPKYGDETSAELSGSLQLQLHARRVELEHPTGGKLIVEAPISRELKEGFERFGFDQHEAVEDPFGNSRGGSSRSSGAPQGKASGKSQGRASGKPQGKPSGKPPSGRPAGRGGAKTSGARPAGSKTSGSKTSGSKPSGSKPPSRGGRR